MLVDLKYYMYLFNISDCIEQTYGPESVDTATAWNNEACCLFCMRKRGEARVRFERAWTITCRGLGHRHPRAIVMWKNLDKARRSHASTLQRQKDLNESVSLRPDADRLILGGEFVVKAIPPAKESSGGKKKKSSGKKSKK